ncbi:MAG: amidohydrolase family protein, partial [Bacteroidales bacterium]|nr:amidohydrolase family protein [Bacteroidales bacterium]
MASSGTLLLRGVTHEGGKCNILVKDGRFADLNAPEGVQADCVLDCGSYAIVPAFYNTHTHAAMTVLRGYADDMPLYKWLTEYIWPYEAKMAPEDFSEGSEIALREMNGSGTVFFNDMYFNIDRTIEKVVENGTRAAIGVTVMENHTPAQGKEKFEFIKNWNDPTGGRIQITVAPHAIYTVGAQKFREWSAIAREYGLKIHIHLSETIKEVE